MIGDNLELEPIGYIPLAFRGTLHVPTKQEQEFARERNSIFVPIKNGYHDPVSHLLVLDTLLRLKKDQRIRAAALKEILDKEAPQIAWDTVTIGRIMGELCDIAEDVSRGKTLALHQSRDRHSTYFTINGIDGYRWIGELRHAVRARAKEAVDMARKGLSVDRAQGFWEFDDDTYEVR